MRTGRRRRCSFAGVRGFTLVELLIVIAIMAILMSVAAPNYQQNIRRAKETMLRQNLYELRKGIDMFTMDKARGPQSLDELVSAGYFRVIPKDPITNQTDWEVVMGEEILTLEQTEPGIVDVRSASSQQSTEGTAYDTW